MNESVTHEHPNIEGQDSVNSFNKEWCYNLGECNTIS
jgi:hypothetical protein